MGRPKEPRRGRAGGLSAALRLRNKTKETARSLYGRGVIPPPMDRPPARSPAVRLMPSLRLRAAQRSRVPVRECITVPISCWLKSCASSGTFSQLGRCGECGWEAVRSASARRGVQPLLVPLLGGRFRNRTPGPPPFSSMNSTPAFSSACCSLSIVDCFASAPFSMRVTVLAVTPAFSASSRTPQPTAARAILT